ncbi:MAG TPA: acyl-CoA dehydrogenase family protein, partial [Nitrospiraceae bacterium]|nr:acyl-CoA dehydrogenase family protein [Nitrospiraceae bacterium]
MVNAEQVFKGSLAAAEASRDTKGYSGFMSGLFEGVVRRHLFHTFSLSAMSQEAQEFEDQLRRVLIEKVDPERIDREGEITEDVFTALRQIGAFGIKIPKTYGGLGLSQTEYHTVATLMGGHDASSTVLLSAHNSIGVAEPLKLVGDAGQKARFLPRLARGEISGFALTEKNAGCDIWDLKSYAIPVRQNGTLVGYRVTADKLYTTNAPRGDNAFLASLLIVIAQIVEDPHEVDRPKDTRQFGAFVVETDSAGCRCARLRFLGVRGIYNGEVHLRDVFVPVEDRLGEEGTGLRRALESLTVGRLTLPAACLGVLKKCLWFARLRAAKRVQYDRPIGEHTDIGAKLVAMASRVLALEALVKITALWADAKEDVRLESAAVKILATEWLLESLLDLFRIYGGRAFETPDSLRLRGEIPVPIERMIRDSLINVIWEGTNGILTLWIGREGLEQYFQQGKGFLNFQLAEMLQATPFFITVASRSLNRFGYEKNGTAARHEAWERFVAEKSRELARKTLLVTARHRQRLVPKQMLMTRFVKASMHLLAIEAVVWYVSQPEVKGNGLAQGLLEHFCSQLREEFDPTPLLSMQTSCCD